MNLCSADETTCLLCGGAHRVSLVGSYQLILALKVSHEIRFKMTDSHITHGDKISQTQQKINNDLKII